nr:MAG TPA: single-stranded DNA binding protein [Caudoviricetes sp.]
MEIQFRQDKTDKGLSLSYLSDGSFFLEVFDDADDTGMNIPLDADELELVRNCIDHILKRGK